VKFDERKHCALIEPLTELLHDAYRPLAEKGMRYLATHQPPETTLKRLKKGDSFLGFIDGELVSTITVVTNSPNSKCAWYQKPEVFFFSQFAVKPTYQGLGLGRRLMDFVEEYATVEGAKEMSLDTSEHAHHLISIYKNRGYRFVEYVQWDVTNYRSVILSKTLQANL
jgi:GNAT superfamily N-acetyltransferase